VITSDKAAAILDRIQKIPIFSTLRMQGVAFGEGTAEMTVPRQLAYDGVFESFHGGILMTIADSVACFAVATGTPDGQAMTTTDMNIRFLAPCLSDVRAKARVIKFGRLMCPVAVDLFDASGKLVAVAQVNYMLLDRIPQRAN
jgi:1,4-dihydroxy-2-naphthoyl-CoA hydrolase